MSIAASTVVLPSGGERRLVDRRREPAAQRSLVVDDGCDVRAGYRSLDHATRVTLLTWLPLTRGELAILENGLLVQAPPDAVSLLFRPPTIWSLADASLSLPGGPTARERRPGTCVAFAPAPAGSRRSSRSPGCRGRAPRSRPGAGRWIATRRRARTPPSDSSRALRRAISSVAPDGVWRCTDDNGRRAVDH